VADHMKTTLPLRARIARLIGIGILAGATLTVVTADLYGNGAITGGTASWLLLLTSSIAILAAAIRAGRAALSQPLSLLLGLYCAVCVILAVVCQSPLFEWGDVEFVLAAPGDSARTFLEMGGPAALAAAIAVALLAGLAFGAPLATISREFARVGPSWRLLLIAVVSAASLAFVGTPHSRLSTYPKELLGTGDVLPAVDPTPHYAFTSGENVFIVQMESLNGLVLNGDYVIDGKPVTGDFLPGMRRLAAKGISIPYFWSHDVFTHRAQQSILCGAVRNLNPMYFDTVVPRTTACLPELFQKGGYKTVFLSNYWDGDFSKTNHFMRRIGFRDLHFADFMKPNDPASVWGFDEKTFFTRAFDYLESQYRGDEKLFVYLAISTHHAFFTRERLSDLQWFQADRATQIRRYLESARIQDESLLTFYSRLQQFTGGNAHAFFVTDHGFPLGLYGGSLPSHGATIDNYLTPFLYLPPARRAEEFALGRRIGDVSYAQSDLLPTIAELLSGKPHRNSFVPFMKRETAKRADYERCHVMVQPLVGRMIVVAREQNLYEYSAVAKRLREYRLTSHPMRQVLVSQRENVSWAEFDRLYGCDRYRPVPYTTARVRSQL